ncbi:MAG: hypothetical protein M4579_003686 [Chaenotheca gracillima]|nr:MAG: hypothetical protein M4579_003686 [Chaenotheca gracillima]
MVLDSSDAANEDHQRLERRLSKRRASTHNFERSLHIQHLFADNDDPSSKLPTDIYAQKDFSSPSSSRMPTGFDARAGGDPVQIKNKKQSMADLKLRRLTELNLRLREDLDRPRIKVSEAAMGLITYTSQTRDFMVPQMWGNVDRRDDPYAPQQSAGCCLVM